MTISLNLTEVIANAANTREYYNAANEIKLANAQMEQSKSIDCYSITSGKDGREYIRISTNTCRRITIPATETNITILLQYIILGRLVSPLRTLEEEGNDVVWDGDCQLAMLAALVENHKMVSWEPEYRYENRIKGVFATRHGKISFSLPKEEAIINQLNEWFQLPIC